MNGDDVKPDKITSFLFTSGFYISLIFVVIIIVGNILDTVSGHSKLEINNLANSILVVSSLILTVLSFNNVKAFFDRLILNPFGRKAYFHFWGIMIFLPSVMISAEIYTRFNWTLVLSDLVSLICVLISLYKYYYDSKK